MDFSQLVRERCSVRKFSEAPVEPEKLRAVLEAGRLAPTACNNQPQRIYVLQSPEALAKIRGVVKYAFNAPIVLMICVNEDAAWKNQREPGFSSGEMDATIVCDHMMLQAADLGLGTTWVRGYTTEDVMRAFPLPLGERLVCLLPLGYPAEDARPAPQHSVRRPMEDLVKTL